MQREQQRLVEEITENRLEPCIVKIPFPLSHEAIAETISSFLKENPQLDAVLFATNYLAIGGLKAITDLGLKIPDNIAVIGFDENYLFSLFAPAITVVSQPVEEISSQIVKKLMASLSEENRKTSIETIVLPTKLIIRASSINKSISFNQKRSLD